MKDAAATALYGTRATNGVIVVTTKKGQSGPPRITYSTQFKLVRRPRYTDNNINLMNSEERVQFGKDLVDMHYAFPSNMTMVGYEGAYYNYEAGNINYDELNGGDIKNYGFSVSLMGYGTCTTSPICVQYQATICVCRNFHCATSSLVPSCVKLRLTM